MEIFDVSIFLVYFCQKHKFNCNYFLPEKYLSCSVGETDTNPGWGKMRILNKCSLKIIHRAVLNTINICKNYINYFFFFGKKKSMCWPCLCELRWLIGCPSVAHLLTPETFKLAHGRFLLKEGLHLSSSESSVGD